MPSPFPGMDPYLESPRCFPDFHAGMIAYLKEFLQPNLPETYYARSNERVWVEITERYVEPDVSIVQPPGQTFESGASTSTAIAPPRAEPVVIQVPHDERTETFLEIYTRKDGDEQLVTAIEVLSISNKTPGDKGQDLYLRKQKEFRYSDVNLVEIDLLRGGKHTTAVSRARALRKAGHFDYHVCIHPRRNLEDFIVYPILLHQQLPEINIPLLGDDGPVKVDLQAVFERCYEAGAYHRQIRYGEDTLDPPLPDEQAQWAKELVGAK